MLKLLGCQKSTPLEFIKQRFGLQCSYPLQRNHGLLPELDLSQHSAPHHSTSFSICPLCRKTSTQKSDPNPRFQSTSVCAGANIALDLLTVVLKNKGKKQGSVFENRIMYSHWNYLQPHAGLSDQRTRSLSDQKRRININNIDSSLRIPCSPAQGTKVVNSSKNPAFPAGARVIFEKQANK